MSKYKALAVMLGLVIAYAAGSSANLVFLPENSNHVGLIITALVSHFITAVFFFAMLNSSVPDKNKEKEQK